MHSSLDFDTLEPMVCFWTNNAILVRFLGLNKANDLTATLCRRCWEDFLGEHLSLSAQALQPRTGLVDCFLYRKKSSAGLPLLKASAGRHSCWPCASWCIRQDHNQWSAVQSIRLSEEELLRTSARHTFGHSNRELSCLDFHCKPV